MPYLCKCCNQISLKKSKNIEHCKTENHIVNTKIYKKKLQKKNLCDLFKDYPMDFNDNIDNYFDKIIIQHSNIIISEEEVKKIKFEDNINIVELSLNHELTQFTKGKTEQTLKGICERYLLNSCEMEEHLIEVIITNLSLAETQQWKIRTKKKFIGDENINIDILSSKKESDYRNIDSYITDIMTSKNKNELPNILIICFHKKRVVSDLLKLFDVCSGNNYMIEELKIKFNLNFDEPDSNLGILSKFLEKYERYKPILKGIQFITATPFEDFWNVLQKNKINELLNFQKKNLEEKSYSDYLKDYRKVSSHIIKYLNYDTDNPLNYIKKVYNDKFEMVDNGENKYGDNLDYINKNKRMIIFAPGHLYTKKKNVGSHEEIVNYFREKGFWCYLSNGYFKGFIQPNGTRILLEDFNKQNNIEGELRDSLRYWNELYPEANMVITGYWTIERGITFCTNGFNFSHIIISKYHTNKLNKLIQLVGRSTGHCEYVDRMILVCPKSVYDVIDDTIRRTVQIREFNPTNYNQTDFSNKNSAIPVRIEFMDDSFRKLIFQSITKKKGYKDNFHRLFVSGILKGKIKVDDKNNYDKFINEQNEIIKSVKNIKVYKLGDKIDSRRFKQFEENCELRKGSSQTCEPGEYNIDLALDDYINGSYTNNKNVAWVTFKR